MRCPTLKELPAPPHDRTGWPWTIDSYQLPVTMANGSLWPKISIVTPSYNQGQFIEETIRSVLLQGYPSLEYIIIDGGSTDESLDIIRKYENWITYWVSEPDKGQSHAINKGFAGASGEKIAYINSDDLYEPDAFKHVASAFAGRERPRLVAGECIVFNGDHASRVIKPWWPEDPAHFVQKTYSSTFAQPSCFWDKEIYFKVGKFDESFHFCFDREFFLRFSLLGVSPCLIPDRISSFREHCDSKTICQAVHFHKESIRILEKHAKACGVSLKEKNKIIRQINGDISYSEIFIKWKEKGRPAALIDFFNMIIKCPSLMIERKILGQARRLISFRRKNVEELKS